MFFITLVRELLRALADPKPHDHTPPWNGRCVRCGHRLGKNVRQTRELPVWMWGMEIWGRANAVQHGRTKRYGM